LVDKIHALDMKVGLYSDSGTKTCAQRIGSHGHEELDAATFAKWKIDCRHYCPIQPLSIMLTTTDLKYDDCWVPKKDDDECAHCEFPDYKCPE